jgi:hypothetical protein
MNKNLIPVTFLLGLILLCLTSFKNFSQTNDSWLPADFDPKQGVLLIQKVPYPQRQQRLIEEFMEKNYPYKYKFVSIKNIEDIDSTKCSDSSSCRFVVLYNYDTHKMHENDFRPESQKIIVGMYDFQFYDRNNKTTYPATGKGASWASVPFKSMMNNILKKFK